MRRTRVLSASLLALGSGLALSACDLEATVGVSAEGVADVSLEVGIDRDLIDDPDLSCQQVMDGVLEGYLPVDDPTASITAVDDADALRCRLTEQVSLPEAGWDGQSGNPLWSADASTGSFRFLLPLSQGTGSGSLPPSDLDALGVDADVTLTVTMPAPVTSASEGTVQGDTVTVTGVKSMVTDLDIRTGEAPDSTGTPTWLLVTLAAAAALLLGAVALVAHSARSRRRRPRRPEPPV
jgi:hypothetical protein